MYNIAMDKLVDYNLLAHKLCNLQNSADTTHINCLNQNKKISDLELNCYVFDY